MSSVTTLKSAKKLTGAVTSNSAKNTITVRVERRVKHPLYGKYMRRSKKYHVHDERDECQVGDVVVIEETIPISKLKRWKLVEILDKGN